MINHGITAYSEPYNLVATALLQSQFDIFGLDLRGHGLSDGSRGHYPSKKVLIQDLESVINHLRKNYKNIIIMGHSLGIITALEFITNFPDKIAGIAIFSGARTPREGVYKKTPKKIVVNALFWSIFKPSKPTLKYYREGMTGIDDPLFNFNYTLKFLSVLNAKKIPLPKIISVPVYVAIGDQDEIFSVDSAREFFNEIQAKDKTFYIIPNGHHADLTEKTVVNFKQWLISKFNN